MLVKIIFFIGNFLCFGKQYSPTFNPKQICFWLLSLLLSCNSFIFAQPTCASAYTFQFENAFRIYHLEADSLDNLFLDADYFYNNPLGPGWGSAAFIMDYNFDSGLKWKKIIKDSKHILHSCAISADNIGNCYLGIGYVDTLNFENLPTYITMHNKAKGLLMKINDNGYIENNINIGRGAINSIAYSNNNVYITCGLMEDSLVFGNDLLFYSDYPFFLGKLDSNLNPLWGKNSSPISGNLTSSNALWSIGGFYEKDTLVVNGISYYHSNGALLLKSDPVNGNPLQIKQIALHNTGANKFIGTKNNVAYLSGDLGATLTSDGTTITPLHQDEFFIYKFDSLGNTVWGITGGGPGFDRISDMKVDDKDNIYVTGYYQNDMQFLGATLHAVDKEMFVAKISSEGTLIWIKDLQGIGESEGNAITLGPNNTVYVAGVYSGELTMDDVTLSNYGAFILKIEDRAVGLNENAKVNNSVSVYPNPTGNIINITCSGINCKQLLISVKNNLGQTVYSLSDSNISNEYKRTIDLSKENKGIYFIEIIADDKRDVRKVIVQ